MKRIKQFFKSKGVKVVLIILAIVSVGLILNAAGALNGAKAWIHSITDAKTRNSENLIDSTAAEYNAIAGDHNGVKVTVNKDGTITLEGTANEATSLLLGTLDVEANEIVTINKTGVAGVCVKVVAATGEEDYSRDLSDVTFYANDDTYSVYLTIDAETELKKVTVSPMITAGSDAGHYYSIVD